MGGFLGHMSETATAVHPRLGGASDVAGLVERERTGLNGSRVVIARVGGGVAIGPDRGKDPGGTESVTSLNLNDRTVIGVAVVTMTRNGVHGNLLWGRPHDGCGVGKARSPGEGGAGDGWVCPHESVEIERATWLGR